MLLALILAAGVPNATVSGDFDRDGRLDRVRLEKSGETYRLMMYRAAGDTMPVELNVPVTEGFKLRKVKREDRVAACQFASLSRYACDAGDMVQYGTDVQSAMAVWNGQRFLVYRPPYGQPNAAMAK